MDRRDKFTTKAEDIEVVYMPKKPIFNASKDAKKESKQSKPK